MWVVGSDWYLLAYCFNFYRVFVSLNLINICIKIQMGSQGGLKQQIKV